VSVKQRNEFIGRHFFTPIHIEEGGSGETLLGHYPRKLSFRIRKPAVETKAGAISESEVTVRMSMERVCMNQNSLKPRWPLLNNLMVGEG
jgi:hypothetical protein